MESMSVMYHQHIETLQKRIRTVLEKVKADAVLFHSGEPHSWFMDDQYYPFKVNPHFKAWVPVTQVPHCWLLVDGVNKPKLWFYSPVDYWHSVEPLPESFWTKEIELIPLRHASEIAQQLPEARQGMLYVGEHTRRAQELGIQEERVNPAEVINYLHFHRSYKTDYEIASLKEAQKLAVVGHQAAKEAFLAGMSEFDINMAFLMATGQRDTDVPYGNIIALNEHAAVLHYTKLEQGVPEKVRSFLIDAGAEYHGYAADITRTYSTKSNNDFAALLKSVNDEQLALIATLKSGVRFTDYHVQMHQRIAKLLKQHQLISGMTEEAMLANGVTTPFFPHGLGHPLGLQVHDVAGFMQSEQGEVLPAPKEHPYLRCTRMMEPRMVMTIEPGLYFIESLLTPWRAGSLSQHFNWAKIDALKPYGGIRIEDNVIIKEKRVENMTRDLALS